jgi:GH25 family lysozyme M1 (1,4-beta-N-acetylmuramidase)
MGKRMQINFQKESKKYQRRRFLRSFLFIPGLTILLVLFFIFLTLYFIKSKNQEPICSDKIAETALNPICDSINRSKTYDHNQSIDTIQNERDHFLNFKTVSNDTIWGYYGINVSEWQHLVDWKEVFTHNESQKIKYVIIKATRGIDELDFQFKNNWNLEKVPDVLIGASHTYKNGEDPLLQAENYIRNVKLKKGNLLPVVDIGLSITGDKKVFTDNLRIFTERLETVYGVKPILYTGTSVYDDYLRREFKNYKYWLAQYSELPPKGMFKSLNNQSKYYPSAVIWQYSYKGEIAGITTTVCMNFLPKENLDSIIY